jgi:trehalose synthase-fused probable maltokinase
MTEARVLGTRGDLDESVLVEYLREQRWFGANTREVTGAAPVDIIAIGAGLAVALVDVQFRVGTHDLYQLLIEQRDGKTFDATRRPELARRLVELVARSEVLGGRGSDESRMTFRSIRPIAGMDTADARALDGDQSNTSLVVGDAMLKAYRRVEAGMNPELDMMLFFAEHGFEHVPNLVGWYGYEGTRVVATLGVVQRFVPDAIDGWQLGLDEGVRVPDRFVERIHQLGAIVGAMHAVLASSTTDAAFVPEEPTPEATGLLTAKIEEEIDAIFDEFSEREELALLVGRRDDAHSLLSALGSALAPGRSIRTHGDLHLAQTLWNGRDWFVIDFEGEPARPASTRRQKALPLRDVAGLLRSVSYLVWTLERQGNPVPDGWEQRARERLLAGYRETAPAAVLPSSAEAQERQLGMFELEKAFYELRYELDHRPDCVNIPVRSILAILERGAP